MGLEEVYTNYKVLRVIPPTGYDTEETDIPVMVKIGRSAGKYRDDASDVFEKLGASYQKMAISLDDGVTECPVEVAEWDVDRQLGILFVKIPSVPTTGMTLKLWYDPTHADNTTNIGTIGSAVGQSVWANGFAGVWHMKNSGGLVLDSTANANHGTVYGATVTQGPLGACYSYDGVDDEARCGNIPTSSADVTLEILWAPGVDYSINLPNAWYGGIGTYGHGAYGDSAGTYLAWASWEGRWVISAPVADNTSNRKSIGETTPMAGGIPYHIVGVKEGQNLSLYRDGAYNGASTLDSSATIITATDFRIASGGGGHLHGMVQAVLYSKTARSPAWIALTNASLKDELITFSTPGTESLTGNERMRLMPDGTLVANEFVEIALTGNERTRLMPDGTLIADEFMEV